jgi:hypothetical protein
MAVRREPVTGEPGGVRCERCDNPINEREGIWVRDQTGRLRISTLDHLDPVETEDARVWHTGCLHTGPHG